MAIQQSNTNKPGKHIQREEPEKKKFADASDTIEYPSPGEKQSARATHISIYSKISRKKENKNKLLTKGQKICWQTTAVVAL